MVFEASRLCYGIYTSIHRMLNVYDFVSGVFTWFGHAMDFMLCLMNFISGQKQAGFVLYAYVSDRLWKIRFQLWKVISVFLLTVNMFLSYMRSVCCLCFSPWHWFLIPVPFYVWIAFLQNVIDDLHILPIFNHQLKENHINKHCFVGSRI